MLNEQFYKACEVGKYFHRPRFDGGQDFGMVVLDLIRHRSRLAKMLTYGKASDMSPTL